MAIEAGNPEDLLFEQRQTLAKTGDERVYRFRSSDGQTYVCVAKELEFTLKPWLDLERTTRNRRRSAERGFPAQDVVEAWLDKSVEDLIGLELPCRKCLRLFRYQEEHLDCPHCGWPASPCSTDRLLRSFFHVRDDLYRSSGCQPLPASGPDMNERYRLIIYSYWSDHWIIEAERRGHSAQLRARAWDRQAKQWVLTGDRGVLPAEWRRLVKLIELAPFWDLPSSGGGGGMDGADYVFEGFKEGRYHYVKRWSPDPERDDENFA